MSYLDNTGLAYLWGKIKAAFAAKSHTHSASDVTSGTLPISRGGTGAFTAADAAINIVNGQAIVPASVTATGEVSGTKNGTAHILSRKTNRSVVTSVIEETNTATQSRDAESTPFLMADGKLYHLNSIVMSGGSISSGGTEITITDAIDDILHEIAQQNCYASGAYPTGYSSGDYFMINRTIRRATQDIAVNAAITDSNSEPVTVMNELADAKAAAKDASNITSGTLPVARGGTGQSGLVSEYVVANVATAGTGCSILGVQYHQWGKVAQLYIGIRCTSAKSSGNVLATIVSGKRPMMTTPLTNLANASQFCAVYDSGQVQAKSSLAAGAEVYVIGTYLLP
jgi:hypothetical protein